MTSKIRKLIEASKETGWALSPGVRHELETLADAAEAELKELEAGQIQGVVVPHHQYANACKQRDEAFARARGAEAQLAERDRADAEFLEAFDKWRRSYGADRDVILDNACGRWAAKGGK